MDKLIAAVQVVVVARSCKRFLKKLFYDRLVYDSGFIFTVIDLFP